MSDGRKKLRAHWPPRLKQTVQVELPDWLYADLYTCAQAEGWSLADEIRARLRGELPDDADRRPADVRRAVAGPASNSERTGP
jgi:hypothetical protein